MKENYIAWDLKIEDFFKLKNPIDKIKFLIRFAVLAPSSHNSQPWLFSIDKNKIYVYKNPKYTLPVADKNDRQLFISIGCAIENIIIAAGYYGYSTTIQYFPVLKENLVAIIKLELNNQIKQNNSLINAILNRKTNRGKYKNIPIDKIILNEILSSVNEDNKIFLFSDNQTIEKLGNIAIRASVDSMKNSNFRYELSNYIKNNKTKSKVGMPGFSLGLPLLISFLLPILIKYLNMEKIGEKNTLQLFKKHTPYLIILASKNDDIINWINIGRNFQKISLFLTVNKISTSPFGAPIEIGNYYSDIQKIINSKYRPQMFFRMGYAENKSSNSPRISYSEVII